MTGNERPRTLVIGVGNRDRGDDAAGPLVVDALRGAHLGSAVETSIIEGDLSDLVLRWDRSQSVIVIDAAVTGASPGTIHRGLELGSCRRQPISSHGMSLEDAIELGRKLGREPERLTIIGIEARSFSHFDDPDPEVQKAIVLVADELIDGLRAASCE